nr:PREDICTED: 10 kDa heat shock protein, mitochondrial [Balearica regulorum gibbericeps]
MDARRTFLVVSVSAGSGYLSSGALSPCDLAGKAFRKFLPLFDRVLVERCAAETVTKGGIMIPEKAQGKVLQATVVAVGSGARGKNGEIQPVSVKVGEKVLLPEYGGTKIVLEDKDYYLFRDGDILGKYVD